MYFQGNANNIAPRRLQCCVLKYGNGRDTPEHPAYYNVLNDCNVFLLVIHLLLEIKH